MNEIRPSGLSALAACPVYVSDGGSSDAMTRGTRIDNAIRAEISGEESPETVAEDQPAIRWGVATLRNLAKGERIETREEYLAMHVECLSSTGTADALCKSRSWVADIKTGRVRDYRLQMAAYALACMQMFYAKRWTAHVVYVDQLLVRSYEFTEEEAQEVVDQKLSRATSNLARPRPSEYCDWCANRNSCSALVHQSQEALANVRATSGQTLEKMRESLMVDPQTMGNFAARWKFVEKEIAEPVLAKLRQELESGVDVDGWKLTKPGTRHYVEPADILPIVKMMTPEQAFFAGGGKMSAESFVEAAMSLGIESPEQLVKSAPSNPQMRQTKKKN